MASQGPSEMRLRCSNKRCKYDGPMKRNAADTAWECPACGTDNYPAPHAASGSPTKS
jgi:hypothetical protein